MITTRRTILTAAAAAPALTGALPSSATELEVGALIEHAAHAHAALMQGDLDRYLDHIHVSGDFTLMAPFGGRPTRGAELSPERWAAVGRFFKDGHDSTFELVQSYRSNELVVLAAIERTVAEVGGLAAQPWALRVTLVFRRDVGQWRLVHRHADPLVEGISLHKAAELASGQAS